MTIEEKIKLIPRKRIKDTRGYFLKVLTGKEEGLPSYTGEIYLTSANPGEAKGGHYHPKANEWFTLLQGKCILKLVDIETGEKHDLELDANIPETIFIPNNIAHIFINISEENTFLLHAYTDQLYDPADTIMYSF
jgi:dTDP-4-dehydrorhamnose 3,5-epimerase-like enzyme